MKLGTVIENEMKGLCTKFQPIPLIHLHVVTIWCFSVACTRPRPSVGSSIGWRGSLSWIEMKLGTVNENDIKGLCIKFQPFTAIHLIKMTIWFFSRAHRAVSVGRSIGSTGSSSWIGMKLGTVIKLDMRGLCTKFEPSSMVCFFTTIFFGSQTKNSSPRQKIRLPDEKFGFQTKNSAWGFLWEKMLGTS